MERWNKGIRRLTDMVGMAPRNACSSTSQGLAQVTPRSLEVVEVGATWERDDCDGFTVTYDKTALLFDNLSSAYWSAAAVAEVPHWLAAAGGCR